MIRYSTLFIALALTVPDSHAFWGALSRVFRVGRTAPRAVPKIHPRPHTADDLAQLNVYRAELFQARRARAQRVAEAGPGEALKLIVDLSGNVLQTPQSEPVPPEKEPQRFKVLDLNGKVIILPDGVVRPVWLKPAPVPKPQPSEQKPEPATDGPG